jgi:hypothetical protein
MRKEDDLTQDKKNGKLCITDVEPPDFATTNKTNSVAFSPQVNCTD